MHIPAGCSISGATEYKLTVVVVPTRNRTDIAKSAIRSVLDQPGCDVRVMVSDNSTEPAQLHELEEYCAQLDDPRLRYVRPPQQLSMPAHWDWAINQALRSYDANHFLYLTDRMMFKPMALKEVLDLASLYPEKIVSYNHDRIMDDRQPIRVEQCPHTGRVLEVKTLRLSYLYSQSVFLPVLPRMLNCVVPRSVFDRIQQRFGNVFTSIAPDFLFCCRCLEMEDSILFYDKSPIFHYALSRSHGASASRGEITSPDYVDFLANLPVDNASRNYATPIPQLVTAANAIANEYLIFKRETQSPRFFEIDLQKYLRANADEINEVTDPRLKAEMLALLQVHGWKDATNGLGPDRSPRAIARKLLSPRAVLDKVRWLARDDALKPFWLLLARRFGVSPPSYSRFEFDRLDDAISFMKEFQPRELRRFPSKVELLEPRVLPRAAEHKGG